LALRARGGRLVPAATRWPEVERVLADHHRDPVGHGGHEGGQVAHRHRLLVRLPVGLALRNALQHATRDRCLGFEEARQQLGDRHRSSRTYQSIFAANCIWRLLMSGWTVVIFPAVGEPMFAFGNPSCGVLKRLNASARSWSVTRSCSGKRLVSDMSTVFCPGAYRIPRPASP